MGGRGVRSGALAWASLAVLVAGAAIGSGCELGVGDTVPPFACVGQENTCPAGQVCVARVCVARASTCAVTGCGPGESCETTTFECVPSDAQAGGDEGTTDDGASDDGPASSDGGADDAARSDADATLLDDAGQSSGDDGESTDGEPGADATLDAPADTTVGAGEASGNSDASDATASDAAAADANDGAAAPDGASGSDGGCQGLLCHCAGNADCTVGFCVGQTTVTTSLYNQAGAANFCTQPCCSSADCGDGTVCFGTGLGGSYCVDPAWVSRSSTLGTALGGASCVTSSQCRSGLCSLGACVDTCCSTTQPGSCTSGATCDLGAFPGAAGFDSHRTGYCNASTSSCGFGSPPCIACRTSSDCSSVIEVCSYAAASAGSADIVATCEPWPTTPPYGTGTQGTPCASNASCASDYCDPGTNECSDVCFTDKDCSAPGWHCRTELATISGVGSNYYVLRCGP
jgi:hypothetical protein